MIKILLLCTINFKSYQLMKVNQIIAKVKAFKLSDLKEEQVFMLTILFVNAGNYLYNLLLGRVLGPSRFADAAILITFLLVLSFIGMTFQIVTAKYTVLFENEKLSFFIKHIINYAIIFGIIIGLLIVIFASYLQQAFNTQNATMFSVFGLGIPVYFVLSVNRGLYQGENGFNKLSITYAIEMLTRLIITFLLIFILSNHASVLVSIGILVSFVFGLYPLNKLLISRKNPTVVTIDKKSIAVFFGLTAFYELTQIIINNSDVILVKHYFENTQAGLYASLALIGRVVYFVAWMFVMLLLPKVIQMKKEGKNTLGILIKYVTYISILSVAIVGFTALFPEFVVQVMFGNAYLSVAPLLWKYALATSLFAVANIFAYYFLSINQYFPVVVSALLGLTQIGLIVLFHNSLNQVVEMQIIAMFVLLFFQLCYFFIQYTKPVKL
jgi:O-antigen/teichoic acid export membrane protein